MDGRKVFGRFLLSLSFTGVIAGILLIFTQDALALGATFIICCGLCYYRVNKTYFSEDKTPGQEVFSSSYFKKRRK